MGYEGIRGRTGARAWEVIHIYTGSFTPSPDPTPFYRRLISTRKGGLTTNGIHLLIPASLSNRSGPPHRIRSAHAPANFATIKHMASNLLRRGKGKHSMRASRHIAGWDEDFLYSLLTT